MPVRILNLPDFRTVSSFVFAADHQVLFIGCTRSLVVFKEYGNQKFSLVKIVGKVFEKTLDIVKYYPKLGRLAVGSREEGLVVMDVQIKGLQEFGYAEEPGSKLLLLLP